MYKIIEFIDNQSHKYLDNYVYEHKPGWRAVNRIRNFICDKLDKYYV